MTTFSVREVVEQAIQTEKLGNEFYIKMAERFLDHSELKKLFELLAAQEAGHELNFSNLKNRLTREDAEGLPTACSTMLECGPTLRLFLFW